MNDQTRREFLARCLKFGLAAYCIKDIALLSGCGKQKWVSGYKGCNRIMVLGMDGLDFGIVKSMMAAGGLPNFSKLAQKGSFAPLTPSNPVMSPAAWSNICTGTKPAQHGIYDFLNCNPENYTLNMMSRKVDSGPTSTRFLQPRRRDGFWVNATKADIPTSIIRWPVAFPTEKVNGRFLSGLGVPDILGNEGRYLYYTTAAIPSDDPSPHNVVKVKWDGNIAKTLLIGPLTSKGKFASVPMTVSKEDAETVKIDLRGSGFFRAVKGKWTDFVKVVFRVGIQKIYGIAKFILLETVPHLRLYASPIHIDPVNQMFPITYPKKYGRELTEHLGLFHTLGISEMVHPLSHGRYGYDEFLSEVEQIETERTKMFEIELDRFDQGVLGFVFDHTDRVQHAFWSMRDKGHPIYNAQDAKKYSDVIPSMYRRMDKVLGMALKKDNDKTAILVVSDHGFNSFRYNVHLNRWLINNGYMKMKGENSEERLGSFKDVNWSCTKAYAVGFASIYINVAQREAKGIVRSGSEQNNLCKEIAARLRTFKDPRNGDPVVHNTYINESPQSPKNSSYPPDLLVGLKPNYRVSWQSALGGAPTMLVDDNTQKWSGDHMIDPGLVPGIFFCNKKLKVDAVCSIDIAPTIFKFMGLDVPDYMDGLSLL